MKFFSVSSVDDCIKIVKENLDQSKALKSIELDLNQALNKTLSLDILSNDFLPTYDRSTVDGYAVYAQDVYCASQSVPAFLKVVGNIKIGEIPSFSIKKGEAAQITTGAVLPQGATGVVMVENVEVIKDDLAVYSPIKQLENTIKKGEEVKPNDIVAKRGQKLTPFLVGVLAGLGITKVNVFDSYNVAIISTGDELVDFTEEAKDGKIRDINTSLLESFSIINNVNVVAKIRIKDSKEELANAIKTASMIADIVLMSGGSSIGQKDYSNEVLSTLGEVFVHGIAQKPGKPTILAKVNNKLVFGLPGNPFAAALNYKELCLDVIGELRGEAKDYKIAKVGANFPSSPGRLTMQAVKLVYENSDFVAYPVFLKSAHLATILQADGYVKIPTNAEGINVGEMVKVYPFF